MALAARGLRTLASSKENAWLGALTLRGGATAMVPLAFRDRADGDVVALKALFWLELPNETASMAAVPELFRIRLMRGCNAA